MKPPPKTSRGGFLIVRGLDAEFLQFRDDFLSGLAVEILADELRPLRPEPLRFRQFASRSICAVFYGRPFTCAPRIRAGPFSAPDGQL